jgi:predicted acetyltransferase
MGLALARPGTRAGLFRQAELPAGRQFVVLSVQIRHLTEADTGVIARIWGACWPEPPDPVRTKETPHFDPLRPEDVSLLTVDGRPVACISYGRHELAIGDARLGFGAVGNLATELGYQRRGYGSRLMGAALQEMRARGDTVTGLFTFSYDFYRRFGYEVCADHCQALVVPATFGGERCGLPAFTGADRVRRFRRTDLPAMSALYDDRLARCGWGLVRPPAYWDWAGDWLTPQECVVCEPNSQLEGYLIVQRTPRLQLPDEYTFRREEDTRVWPADLGPVLHVVEMVVSTTAARHALLGWLAGQAGDVDAIVWPLACRSDLEACGFLVPGVRLRVIPGPMFRLIDPAEAVRARTGCADWIATCVDVPALSFAVSDPMALELGCAPEPFALVSSPKGFEVVPGRREHDHLELSIGAFSQLYLGYRTAADLEALGRMESSSARAISTADRLFGLYEPCMGELDLF